MAEWTGQDRGLTLKTHFAIPCYASNFIFSSESFLEIGVYHLSVSLTLAGVNVRRRNKKAAECSG